MAGYTEMLQALSAPEYRWSFSRLNTFHQCPLSFRLRYIDHESQVNNAFAEYGLLCHSILEEINSGV